MKQYLSINLSTDAITREVLAIAALNSLQYNSIDDKIPLLTDDNKPAMLLQAKGSLANILLHMLPFVNKCNINDEMPSDGSEHLFNLEVYLYDDTSPSDIAMLRHALEHTIALDILYVAYLDHNASLSDRYASLARDSLNNVLRLLNKTSVKTARRNMNWL